MWFYAVSILNDWIFFRTHKFATEETWKKDVAQKKMALLIKYI